jgi:hypothetical protein
MTEEKRAAEMRAWADAHGFQYEEVVPDELLALPFYLFTMDTGDVVASGDNLLTGDWQGMPVDVFDVSVAVPDTAQALGLSPSWIEEETITTAIAGTGADLPYVSIEKKGLLTRLADGLDRVDRLHHDHLEVECNAKEFDHHFEVKSTQPDFVHELLSHELMDALLKGGDNFFYEISGRQFIVHTPRDTHDLESLLNATKAVWDLIPSEVVQKYSPAEDDA